jgi:hypothetical protein
MFALHRYLVSRDWTHRTIRSVRANEIPGSASSASLNSFLDWEYAPPTARQSRYDAYLIRPGKRENRVAVVLVDPQLAADAIGNDPNRARFFGAGCIRITAIGPPAIEPSASNFDHPLDVDAALAGWAKTCSRAAHHNTHLHFK